MVNFNYFIIPRVWKNLFALFNLTDESYYAFINAEWPPTLDSSRQSIFDSKEGLYSLRSILSELIKDIPFVNQKITLSQEFIIALQFCEQEQFVNFQHFIECSSNTLKQSTTIEKEDGKEDGKGDGKEVNDNEIDPMLVDSNTTTKSTKTIWYEQTYFPLEYEEGERNLKELCEHLGIGNGKEQRLKPREIAKRLLEFNRQLIKKIEDVIDIYRLEVVERRQCARKLLSKSNEKVEPTRLTKVLQLYNPETFKLMKYNYDDNGESNAFEQMKNHYSDSPQFDWSTVNNSVFTIPHRVCQALEEFMSHLYDLTGDQLVNIDLEKYGVYAGGDLVTKALAYSQSNIFDVARAASVELTLELFVVNQFSLVDAQSRVSQLVDDLVALSNGNGRKYSVFDSEQSIILRSQNGYGKADQLVPIVIHKNVYRSLYELILLTELDSKAVYFSGANVFLSYRTVRAIKLGINTYTFSMFTSDYYQVELYEKLGYQACQFPQKYKKRPPRVNHIDRLEMTRVARRSREIIAAFASSTFLTNEVKVIPYDNDKIVLYFAGRNSAGLKASDLPAFKDFQWRVDRQQPFDYQYLDQTCHACNKEISMIHLQTIATTTPSTSTSFICNRCNWLQQNYEAKFASVDTKSSNVVLLDVNESSELGFLPVLFKTQTRIIIATKYPYLMKKQLANVINSLQQQLQKLPAIVIYYLDPEVVNRTNKFISWVYNTYRKIDVFLYNLSPLDYLEYCLSEEKERVTREMHTEQYALNITIVNGESTPTKTGNTMKQLSAKISKFDFLTLQTLALMEPTQIIDQIAREVKERSDRSITEMNCVIIFSNLCSSKSRLSFPEDQANNLRDLIHSMAIQLQEQQIYLYNLESTSTSTSTTNATTTSTEKTESSSVSSHRILKIIYSKLTNTPLSISRLHIK
ncbi:hypothetical protein PPL_00865 [Heterostelium album PN500]|uniref:Uncharacterized protein n=1 Tax=Heterostelium pallidum (strain ATCC 26659 / Pp 5 / PN500) TaxID=670386 RepID=D3AYU6_HETP5|nr:hypothetical protein PPL_00865 [Heterostelium album PN500]EFA85636.1 hypothetical protein PPL_00865 [Heterostelium album PN500]|eukprot:XP_020437743.1 hypothetical protein PPL_00865 [Heterostelium album PN500]